MLLGVVEATIEDLAFPSPPLEGEQLRFPPSNARLLLLHSSLPPLLGPHKASCDQGGHTPLDPPTSFLCNDVALRRNLIKSGGEDVLSTPWERKWG
jgi:hypothetical protein